MLSKDELTNKLLSIPFECSLDENEKGKVNKKYSDDEIWNTLKADKSLPLETWRVIYKYMTDGEWLIFDKSGDVKPHLDTLSVSGNGMYRSGSKIPAAIFVDGVNTYWPVNAAGSDSFATWNFTKPVTIYEFKVRAEEYDNFGHFASEILLYSGMDSTHKTYEYGIILTTKQCAGWQYAKNIDQQKYVDTDPSKQNDDDDDHDDNKGMKRFEMCGKYWRIVINKTHDPQRYGEIAQIDMRGFVCKEASV